MKHYLYSSDLDKYILELDSYQPEILKENIIKHLLEHPKDELTHEKEYTPFNKKKYSGNEIISFYEINPKTNQPCKIVTIGNKTYYKSLND